MRKTAVMTALLLAGALALAAVYPPRVVLLPLPKPLPLYRFDVQAIHAVETTPCKVVYQVQCYISSTYPKACFIGAHVPEWAHASTGSSDSPAGRLPNGVPKGQVHFAKNVWFEAFCKGGRAFATSTIEVVTYESGANRGTALINWGQTWMPILH